MSSLSGKVAIVAGSSRGIGARIATGLAQAGAGVVVNYAGRRDAAEQVVQSIEAGGGRTLAVQGDVSKPQDVRVLFDAAVERFGRVHILVKMPDLSFTNGSIKPQTTSLIGFSPSTSRVSSTHCEKHRGVWKTAGGSSTFPHRQPGSCCRPTRAIARPRRPSSN